MSLRPKSILVAMICAALSAISLAAAQENPQRGQAGPSVMPPADMNRGNMMQRGAMSGASGPTPQMMEACRGMMQGGGAASGDANKEMLDRCRSMMQRSPEASPDKKD